MLGIHTVVFIRWLQHELDDQSSAGGLWERIRDYVAEEIYDPMFDQNEGELEETEQLLKGMFWESKKNGQKVIIVKRAGKWPKNVQKMERNCD